MSEEEGTKIPGHVLDRFDGHHVVVQLRDFYYLVTYPGVPHAVPNEQGQPVPNRMPVVFGVCKIDKDSRGNVRVVVTRPDPNPERTGHVVVSFAEDVVEAISLSEEQSVIAGSS